MADLPRGSLRLPLLEERALARALLDNFFERDVRAFCTAPAREVRVRRPMVVRLADADVVRDDLAERAGRAAQRHLARGRERDVVDDRAGRAEVQGEHVAGLEGERAEETERAGRGRRRGGRGSAARRKHRLRNGGSSPAVPLNEACGDAAAVRPDDVACAQTVGRENVAVPARDL